MTEADLSPDCELILPCRDEGAALRGLLPRVPASLGVLVVDNGSRDDTVSVALAHGARVVTEPVAGYGSAVQAGMLAARSPYVVVMDGDGSFAPEQIDSLLAPVRAGTADLVLGRRRPVRHGVWPWHARLGNWLVVLWLRRRLGFPAHDLGPIRAGRREQLLGLGVTDRRSGYPVELMAKATRAGLRILEVPVDYHPRARGTRSKVSGSIRGTLVAAHDFWQVLS